MKGFDDAIGIVLALEGGESDVSADRGGKTKYGITQGTLDSVRSLDASLPTAVFDLTVIQVTAIYKVAFWKMANCDSFQWPISLYLFDAVVNHGYKNAVKMLQRALWTNDDGVIGLATISAPIASVSAVAYAMLTLRRVFYATIVSGDARQSMFLKGWLSRIDRLKLELESAGAA